MRTPAALALLAVLTGALAPAPAHAADVHGLRDSPEAARRAQSRAT